MGSLVFTDTIDYITNDSTVGLDGTEIQWDGTFNGQTVQNGVYAAVAELWSCVESSYTICPSTETKHGSDNYQLFYFDITVKQ